MPAVRTTSASLQVLVVAVGLMVQPACGEEPTTAASPTMVAASPSTETATPETTSSPTPTPTEEPTAAEPEYPYKGYPKVVKKGQVPSQMHDYVDGTVAVAVAPGVWTQRISGVSPLESARDGAFFGYCAAVEKAIRKLGNNNGYTCW